MNNYEKKLDALIDALGFDVEDIIGKELVGSYAGVEKFRDCVVDYKLTKRGYNRKGTLHKIIREYEKEEMSASEMIGRIMLLEGISNEDV